jgi:hypothetical protein
MAVMPSARAGDANAPSIMIGEKAAASAWVPARRSQYANGNGLRDSNRFRRLVSLRRTGLIG